MGLISRVSSRTYRKASCSKFTQSSKRILFFPSFSSYQVSLSFYVIYCILKIRKNMSSSAKSRRRTSIPERPKRSINLLKFLKNTVGKELTRLSFPVDFNEPLSMLQRVLECMEFSWILDRAAKENNAKLQAAMVALYHFGS